MGPVPTALPDVPIITMEVLLIVNVKWADHAQLPLSLIILMIPQIFVLPSVLPIIWQIRLQADVWCTALTTTSQIVLVEWVFVFRHALILITEIT